MTTITPNWGQGTNIKSIFNNCDGHTCLNHDCCCVRVNQSWMLASLCGLSKYLPSVTLSIQQRCLKRKGCLLHGNQRVQMFALKMQPSLQLRWNAVTSRHLEIKLIYSSFTDTRCYTIWMDCCRVWCILWWHFSCIFYGNGDFLQLKCNCIYVNHQ